MEELNINLKINNEYENYVQFCLDTKGAASPSSEKQFEILKNYILNTYCNK